MLSNYFNSKAGQYDKNRLITLLTVLHMEPVQMAMAGKMSDARMS